MVTSLMEQASQSVSVAIDEARQADRQTGRRAGKLSAIRAS